jgi:hypothetical protein
MSRVRAPTTLRSFDSDLVRESGSAVVVLVEFIVFIDRIITIASIEGNAPGIRTPEF